MPFEVHKEDVMLWEVAVDTSLSLESGELGTLAVSV